MVLAIFVDKMAIPFVFVIKIRTTPASTVAYVDTWHEIVLIAAEDVEQEVDTKVEDTKAEVEDELNLEEGR